MPRGAANMNSALPRVESSNTPVTRATTHFQTCSPAPVQMNRPQQARGRRHLLPPLLQPRSNRGSGTLSLQQNSLPSVLGLGSYVLQQEKGLTVFRSLLV